MREERKRSENCTKMTNLRSSSYCLPPSQLMRFTMLSTYYYYS